MCRARSLAVLLLLPALLLPAALARAGLSPSSFGPQVKYPVTSYPFSVVVADLNHDNHPDLAVASAAPARASVLLGNGNGTFGAAASFQTGSYSSAIAVGDFDGDGNPDLAVANAQSNDVSVLLGDGAGAFAPAINTSVGAGPYDVAAVDLDRDGVLDLVTANYGVNTITVLHGNGNGTFTRIADPALPSYSRSLAVGDLNGDDWPDLVVAETASTVISVFLNAGDGTFGTRQDVPVGIGPYDVALGDLNGDGFLDAVTANVTGTTFSVLLGHGDGTFADNVDHAIGPYPYGVTIADLDGDHVPDLAFAMVYLNKVVVFLGSGDGGFPTRIDYAAGVDPFCVTTADLQGDLSPDLVVANEGGASISVLLNNEFVFGDPSTTTLSLEPDATVYGQPLVLKATLTPATVVGTVDFYDFTTVIGTASVDTATAVLTTTALGGGPHSLQAVYRGSALNARSESNGLPFEVGAATTTTTVGCASNPAYLLQPIQFTATVKAELPSTAVPVGTVRFYVDGAALGGSITLSNGVATSGTVSSLPEGSHTVTAVFVPTIAANFLGSTSPEFTEDVIPSLPVIAGVRDVPNDQGGKVFVTWYCGLDSPGIHTITGYRIWRRVPAGLRAPEGAVAAPAGRAATASVFWEAVAQLPAAQLGSYGYTAATTQDSLPDGNPYTAFFVQGLTADANTWYNSPVDSGYSVDNLAPPAPSPFVAVYSGAGTQLHWLPSRAPDVAGYRLYRGVGADFEPGPATFLAAVTDTGYLDPANTGQYAYKLAATDVHGNLGRFSVVSPSAPVAAMASAVSAEVRDGRVHLRWYVSSDEPLGLAVERRGLDGAWVGLGDATQDGQGYVAFEDAPDAPGARLGYRLVLTPVEGPAVRAGEMWVDLPLPDGEGAVRIANPAPGGVVEVSFAAPAGPAVRVDLFDTAGRAVATRWAAGGVGRLTLRLAGGGDLPPGVYLVRIGFERPVTRRVVVIR